MKQNGDTVPKIKHHKGHMIRMNIKRNGRSIKFNVQVEWSLPWRPAHAEKPLSPQVWWNIYHLLESSYLYAKLGHFNPSQIYIKDIWIPLSQYGGLSWLLSCPISLEVSPCSKTELESTGSLESSHHLQPFSFILFDVSPTWYVVASCRIYAFRISALAGTFFSLRNSNDLSTKNLQSLYEPLPDGENNWQNQGIFCWNKSTKKLEGIKTGSKNKRKHEQGINFKHHTASERNPGRLVRWIEY